MDTGAENAVPQDGASTPGAILAAERERQGLSRADVAQRLHMSVTQVEALELGDYEHLPRGPFLRGFARNYARLLGIDPESIVGLLAASAPAESAPRIVVPTQNIRFDPLGTRLSNPYVKAAGIATVAIVLGFAAMYWWLFVRPQGAASVPARKPATTIPALPAPAMPAVAPDPSPTGPALSSPPAGSTAEPMPPPSPPSATPASFPEPAPIRQAAMAASPPTAATASTVAPAGAATPIAPAPARPAAAAAPPPAASAVFEAPQGAGGGGLIRMKFRGPAWVEVKDAQGKVLLSRTHPGGSDAEIAGKPPFTLVIGNAADVRLAYNGREVDLEPHTRVAVARLTLP